MICRSVVMINMREYAHSPVFASDLRFLFLGLELELELVLILVYFVLVDFLGGGVLVDLFFLDP